jgi:hypothetical protein
MSIRGLAVRRVSRSTSMETVISRDGTSIAIDRYGSKRQNATRAWAVPLGNAVHQTLPGQTHMLKQAVLAPGLLEFFGLASAPEPAKELALQR